MSGPTGAQATPLALRPDVARFVDVCLTVTWRPQITHRPQDETLVVAWTRIPDAAKQHLVPGWTLEPQRPFLVRSPGGRPGRHTVGAAAERRHV